MWIQILFQVYHEKESLFHRVSLNETNEALTELREKAQKTAIENGFLDNVRKNFEMILTTMFSAEYDPDMYQSVFND